MIRVMQITAVEKLDDLRVRVTLENGDRDFRVQDVTTCDFMGEVGQWMVLNFPDKKTGYDNETA